MILKLYLEIIIISHTCQSLRMRSFKTSDLIRVYSIFIVKCMFILIWDENYVWETLKIQNYCKIPARKELGMCVQHKASCWVYYSLFGLNGMMQQSGFRFLVTHTLAAILDADFIFIFITNTTDGLLASILCGTRVLSVVLVSSRTTWHVVMIKIYLQIPIFMFFFFFMICNWWPNSNSFCFSLSLSIFFLILFTYFMKKSQRTNKWNENLVTSYTD